MAHCLRTSEAESSSPRRCNARPLLGSANVLAVLETKPGQPAGTCRMPPCSTWSRVNPLVARATCKQRCCLVCDTPFYSKKAACKHASAKPLERRCASLFLFPLYGSHLWFFSPLTLLMSCHLFSTVEPQMDCFPLWRQCVSVSGALPPLCVGLSLG